MSQQYQTLERTPRGLSGDALRTLGLVFLTIGVAGVCVLENRVLRLSSVTGEELVAMMQSSGDTMAAVTAALVCRALYLCAVPLFAFLLVEGFAHTGSFRAYLLRVLGVALVSEVPYNLAMSGQVLDSGSRNPVFGAAVALVMLWLFAHYPGRSARNVAIKAAVTLAAFCWCALLGAAQGTGLLLMTLVLWLLREKSSFRGLAGCAGAFACCLISPYYIASPMSMLMIHLYNGEPGGQRKLWKMAAYPAMLTVFAVAAML